MTRAGAALLRSPFDDLPAIRDRLVGRGSTLVALDFDGTLTELVDDPAASGLTEERRALLARIPSVQRRLAIVSGRALEDVRRRIGIPGTVVIGNHGLEIEGLGIHERPRPEVAERLAAMLEEVARAVEGRGVWVENKDWTASVHIRPRDNDELHAEIGEAIEEIVRAAGFGLRAGKATWEIRPAGAPHKGDAILRLIDGLPGAATHRTLYIGDDATDEDAFRALREGVTIRVGEAGVPTAARYCVAAPAEVYRLLESLFPGEAT